LGSWLPATTEGIPDARMSVVNPGSKGGYSPSGDLCANIYVVRSDQQIEECCSCKISPNGLRTFSLNTDLTGNPLTATPPTHGAIKIISSAVPTGGSCLSTSGNTIVPVAGTDYKPFGLLGIWITHMSATTNGSFSVSETGFLPSDLPDTELTKLQSQCNFFAAAELLQMGEIQLNRFMPPQATSEQYSQKSSVTFTLQSLGVGRLPKRFALFGS